MAANSKADDFVIFQISLIIFHLTTLFEGEMDHLLPTASAVLVESELFVMAGRMIGHLLINQGPAMSGLSLAIVHSLTGGTKDTATTNLCLEDCPDIEQRETIRLLLKDEWTEEETSQVSNLCLDFYFAVPNKRTNKMLLFQQLLTHAVILCPLLFPFFVLNNTTNSLNFIKESSSLLYRFIICAFSNCLRLLFL